ncbi:hypothetical protein E1B28_007807 [Marasmius oreades]|uniref:Uncharacterized protein n=1 Tax=Marasmius oreades TaxID=181124 RepID=A0A9P7S2P8_9AGAR|nr:uncharacterized protein E1B28_007807 [Marasmius oreades]KAG7094200.1 hypothetical protein E1B28_007807 [Marasmius oreades]
MLTHPYPSAFPDSSTTPPTPRYSLRSRGKKNETPATLSAAFADLPRTRDKRDWKQLLSSPPTRKSKEKAKGIDSVPPSSNKEDNLGMDFKALKSMVVGHVKDLEELSLL